MWPIVPIIRRDTYIGTIQASWCFTHGVVANPGASTSGGRPTCPKTGPYPNVTALCDIRYANITARPA